MGRCEVCEQREGIKAAVVHGHYYRSVCAYCYEGFISDNMVSSGHADYERGRDAEEHERDILQPQGPDGISREFIEQYPETAKKVFSQTEIDRAIRS